MRLKEIRTKKGISQKELGERIGVTQQRIDQIEKSRQIIIKSEMVRKIADALNVTVYELLEDDINQQKKNISNMEIGNKIRCLREQSGYTQEKLAEHLQISIASIKRYENGDSIPRDEIKSQLAHVFGVSHKEFIPESQEQREYTPEEKIKVFDADWFRIQLHMLIDEIDNIKKLHFIWSFIRGYINNQ